MKRFKKTLWTLVIALALVVAPQIVAAEVDGVQITGDDCGLVISAPSTQENIDNLGPGDVKESQLILTNEGSGSLNVSIKTHIIGNSAFSPRGGVLADILRLTIKDGNHTIIDALPFNEAASLATIDLGSMAVGEQKVLDFMIDFPIDANNDYQGATFQANWTFATTCAVKRTSDDDEDSIVPDNLIPTGPSDLVPVEPTILITADDPIPSGPFETPETGGFAPIYFYGAGSFVLMLGILWRRRAE